MADVATREPETINAGETIEWRREDLADYPAPSWVLTYELRNAAGAYQIAAAASGSAHAVSVTAATSKDYAPGVYEMAGYVVSGAERRLVYRATLTIRPYLGAAGALDTRSHARKVLDAIEAVIENRASKDQQSYRIGDRELVRMSAADLLDMRSRYRAEVAREREAERAALGKPRRRRLLATFTRPS